MSDRVWFQAEGAGVYVIKAVEMCDWRVKVGVTTNVRDRFAALQSASPSVLELVAFTPGATRVLEAAIHDAFAADRLHGEWFQLDAVGMDDLMKAMTTSAHLVAPTPRRKPRGGKRTLGRCTLCWKNVQSHDQYTVVPPGKGKGRKPTYHHVNCSKVVRSKR